MVTMESHLPGAVDESAQGGVLGMMGRAPLFAGIALFAIFFVFFKGKGGGGNSPLGRLGKIFGGGRRGVGRGGSRGRDPAAAMDRWESKHGARAGGMMGKRGGSQSANMRYGSNSGKSRSGMMGGSRRPSLGRGGDWSD